jgi:hypothetical protein
VVVSILKPPNGGFRSETAQKRHIEKWLAFSIPKITPSFGYK